MATAHAPPLTGRYICEWVASHAGPGAPFDVAWYAARYYPQARCIFAAEDLTALVPRGQADCVLLEEPEHLNWWGG